MPTEDVEDEINRFLEEEKSKSDHIYVPLKFRRANNGKKLSDNDYDHKINDDKNSKMKPSQLNDPETDYSFRNQTLVDVAEELRKQKSVLDKKTIKQLEQKESEQMLLKEANQVQTNALQSAEEIARGLKYVESVKTSWTAPRYILEQDESVHEAIRNKWHILVEGKNCPPPIKSFKEMKLPDCILDALKAKGNRSVVSFEFQSIYFYFVK
jgi:ATP-dependent RNA helicase DDX41